MSIVARACISIIAVSSLSACGGSGGGSSSEWDKPARLSAAGLPGQSFTPDVAINVDGAAVTTWRYSDEEDNFSALSRTISGSAMDGEQLISNVTEQDISSLQVAISDNGDGVAVWRQFDGVRWNLWTAQLDAIAGWQAPYLVEESSGTVQQTHLAMNGAGTAVAVWRQYDGVRYDIWSSRYNSGNGVWSQPVLIEDEATDTNGGVHVQVAEDGSAMAVWGQRDVGDPFQIWRNHMSDDGSWGLAQTLDTSEAGSAAEPHVAISPVGTALVVWQRFVDGTSRIQARRCNLENLICSAVANLDPDLSGQSLYPRIAIDDLGRAIAVWESSGHVYASRHDNDGSPWQTSWSAPITLQASDDSADSIDLAMDDSGNAVAIWVAADDVTGPYIAANRYREDLGLWTGEVKISRSVGGKLTPRIALDENGAGRAVWAQERPDLSGYDIYTSRFVAAGQ